MSPDPGCRVALPAGETRSLSESSPSLCLVRHGKAPARRRRRRSATSHPLPHPYRLGRHAASSPVILGPVTHHITHHITRLLLEASSPGPGLGQTMRTNALVLSAASAGPQSSRNLCLDLRLEFWARHMAHLPGQSSHRNATTFTGLFQLAPGRHNLGRHTSAGCVGAKSGKVSRKPLRASDRPIDRIYVYRYPRLS
jgi:hypothetical protein